MKLTLSIKMDEITQYDEFMDRIHDGMEEVIEGSSSKRDGDRLLVILHGAEKQSSEEILQRLKDVFGPERDIQEIKEVDFWLAPSNSH